MSLLGNLFSRILGHSAPSAAPVPTPGSQGTAAAPKPAPTANPAPAPSLPPIPRIDAVDLEALLDGLVAKGGQKLDWRHSIVDLMKAVGMDSSLAERKELARELGYTGDTADSAKMNTWLHREVFKRIAANGGQVPAALKD